jgi:hypothetical protein
VKPANVENFALVTHPAVTHLNDCRSMGDLRNRAETLHHCGRDEAGVKKLLQIQ